MDKMDFKVFNDPIHGHIEMHPLLVRIIDTPQFQRLRNIKQLGGVYFVYPGATHNRFEHSIGVSHLAGTLVQSLKDRQPELGINDQDILCVKIAGLCHDLGHGPFSHLFEKKFIPKVYQKKWKHEEASIQMFDYMVEQNNLEEEMKNHKLNCKDDLKFIKQLIIGTQGKYKGRPEEKSFLYEIVANKRTGIDVDKWDYFARDCHHLGIPNPFDFQRSLKFARVCDVEGKKEICTRDKEVFNMYNMFHTRFSLHLMAYQHKVTNAIENMITDALVKADKHIKIRGSGGKEFTISTAINDMEAYTKLNDSIFQQILHSSEPELAEARQILQNIMRRKIYKCVGQTRRIMENGNDKEAKRLRVNEILAEANTGDQAGLTESDLAVTVVNFDYGMKKKNPIKYMHFYDKDNPNEADEIPKSEVTLLLPEKFSEWVIQVFCKKTDAKSIEAAEKGFKNWSKKQEQQPPPACQGPTPE